MKTLRSVSRSLLLLALLVAAVVDGWFRKRFCGLTIGPAGAEWVSAWSRRILGALGIGFSIEGPLPDVRARGLALVSNHLSYLDILVYSAAAPMIMVAKSEVRQWPLIGWITAQAGTIYVERADVKGGQRQTRTEVNRMMAEAYQSGLPVLFFPEGTTTDGRSILPFRRGLFNSIVYDSVPLRAAAITYKLDAHNQHASVAEHVCYWGEMVFAPHLFLCLGLRGLSVRVAFDAEATAGHDRFELAVNARDRVLGLYGRINRDGLSVRQQALAPQPVDHLFDTPVERLAAIHHQARVGG